MNTDLTVANTILAQLGGNKFRVMTGAKDFIGGPNTLTFKFMRGKDGINAATVALDPSDTYTVTFWKRGRAYSVTEIAKVEGIYADDLRRVFESHTGLATSLGTMGA